MFDITNVDIYEDDILEYDKDILELLLIDRSSGKHIKWATDDYNSYGEGFDKTDFIQITLITGEQYGSIIKPRSIKSKELQKSRARKNAEVFTASWLCNKQNNLVDKSWFGATSPFNTETEYGWIRKGDKVSFPIGKTWMDYVTNPVLEITCGEAPYLVSRYDTTNGKRIELRDRIGLIDRKFRVINENITHETKWVEWALLALKHSYGFELQGDNLLLARENVLLSFMDYYYDRFSKLPGKDILMEVADIISWNIWQMDGLKLVVPYSCHDEKTVNSFPSMFEDDANVMTPPKITPCPGCQSGNNKKHNGMYCYIKNWDSGEILPFISIMSQ